MSGTESIRSISLVASADLSALQYTAIRPTATYQAASATANSTAIVGILQNAPGSGVAAEVAIGGVSKAKAGGTWTAGDKLTATTGGALITTTTTGHHYVGVALEGAAINDLARVLIQPGVV